MVEKQTAFVRLLIIIGLFIAGCSSRPLEEVAPNDFTQGFESLGSDRLDRLVEIYDWGIVDNGGSVSLIQYYAALNRLTVVSEQTKSIVLFSVESEETIAQQIIDISSLRVLGIDEEGERILVGMSGQTWNEQGKPQTFFHWIAIWNVRSASVEECISASCAGELTDPDHIATADIGAALNVETVIAYNENSYVTTILSPESGGAISLVNSPDSDYWWHIGGIAVNSYQNLVAIIFQEGRIVLERISEQSNSPFAWVDVIEQGERNQLLPIHEAKFDPSGKWLAVMRGEDLVIWQIRGLQTEIFREKVSNFHAMRFNPLGKLLFVASGGVIRVIGLKERSVIYEMNAPGITSISLSDDNRLLFWGDEFGVVHIWGIPLD